MQRECDVQHCYQPAEREVRCYGEPTTYTYCRLHAREADRESRAARAVADRATRLSPQIRRLPNGDFGYEVPGLEDTFEVVRGAQDDSEDVY